MEGHRVKEFVVPFRLRSPLANTKAGAINP
jgi:hypothetical protein